MKLWPSYCKVKIMHGQVTRLLSVLSCVSSHVPHHTISSPRTILFHVGEKPGNDDRFFGAISYFSMSYGCRKICVNKPDNQAMPVLYQTLLKNPGNEDSY